MGYFELAVNLTRAEAAPTLAKVANKYVAMQRIAAFVDDDDQPICGNCNGSGEGMHDGSRCYQCGGSGVATDFDARYENECARADYLNDQAREREYDKECER